MAKNTIWIAGASGKMGSALMKILRADVENKIIGTDVDTDITDLDAVKQAAEIYRPNIIINCASISDVDYCEEHMVEAFKVNALGARNLASAAQHVNAKIIQLSTDDVFDGNKSGFVTEFDMPKPISVYAKSKLAAENYVRELNPKHLIVRSSWVYGIGKGDYYSYVLEQGKNGTKFEAPTDYISSPTSAQDLAEIIVRLLNHAEFGIIHASSEGSCSRYDFAKAILAANGLDTNLVVPSTSQLGETSTLLENLMLKMLEIYEMPNWQDGLNEYIESVKEA